MNQHIKWTTYVKAVDIETGEIITLGLRELKKQFIKIKTNKYVKINNNKSKGIIEYTIEYRRNPQTKLFG